MNQHMSPEELQEYLDKSLSAAEQRRIGEHLARCQACRTRSHSLNAVDQALRSLPQEHLDSRFTRSVMSRIVAVRSNPVGYRLLENLAYVFALFVVMAVLLSVFIFTGVVDPKAMSEGQGKVEEIISGAGSAVGASIGAFSKLLTEYAPFAFGGGSLGITGAILAVLIALALFDRVLARRWFGATTK